MKAGPVEPIRVRPRIERGTDGGDLIRRVLRRNGLPGEPVSAVVELDDPATMPIGAAFVDASGGRTERTRQGASAFHCLWCRDERNAAVQIGPGGGGAPVHHAIAPGDTVYVPPGRSFAIGPGILGYEVWSTVEREQADTDASCFPPTHGLERFEGYNRRTVCAAGPDFALERWKVTQPLPLPVAPGRSLFVTNLVEPVAIVWRGGSDLIDRAESRVLPPGLGTCTFFPDGLGYLLVSYVPDPRADVIGQLREAGHSDARIATLGALSSALTPVAPAGAGDDPAQVARGGKAEAGSAPGARRRRDTGT